MARGQDERSIYELTLEELDYAHNWLSLIGTASPVLTIVRREFAGQLQRLYQAKLTGEPIQPEERELW